MHRQETVLNIADFNTPQEVANTKRHLEAIGDGLRVLRFAFPQDENIIAEKLGITVTQVHQLERGQFNDWSRPSEVLLRLRSWLVELDNFAKVNNL